MQTQDNGGWTEEFEAKPASHYMTNDADNGTGSTTNNLKLKVNMSCFQATVCALVRKIKKTPNGTIVIALAQDVKEEDGKYSSTWWNVYVNAEKQPYLAKNILPLLDSTPPYNTALLVTGRVSKPYCSSTKGTVSQVLFASSISVIANTVVANAGSSPEFDDEVPF